MEGYIEWRFKDSMSDHLSVNNNSLRLVRRVLESPEEFNVVVEDVGGARVVDAGIDARGGFEAGRIITEICLGGYGRVDISMTRYDDVELPAVWAYTDCPAVATLGSQLAGWRVNVGGYQAIGSGPGRALALKPKELYEKIGYKDESSSAVIVLEASRKPTIDVLEYLSRECKISLEDLYVFLVPTSSIAGSVQISGRIVETGLHKLMDAGFDPRKAISGFGYAPIAPVHPKLVEAMGRTNDMILYGGVAYITVEWEDDSGLRKMVERVPSSASKDYGRPFAEVFREAAYDFYKVDPGLFAPASIIINNVKTGKLIKAGRVNVEVLKESILR